MEIELCGYNVLIDTDDYEKVKNFRWFINRKSERLYGKVYFEYKHSGVTGIFRTSLHRLIMGLKTHDGKVVDHINGNTLDNRRQNLRICTIAENNMNARGGKRKYNLPKGAYKMKLSARYMSQITLNKTIYYLGYYDTPEEAHAAYCEASKKYHGEFGRTD